MGPIVLFDKSFIEMLNLDEAALFDFMYLSNICPIYLIEVLADLEKEKPGERTREKIVADVANKTPSIHSYPNVLHTSICFQELLGYVVEMGGRPIVAGGKAVRVEGKVGVYYEESPEMMAFNRWQAHRFFEVERDFARGWRAQLMQADLSFASDLAHWALQIKSEAKNLDEAYQIAKGTVLGDRNRYHIFKAAYLLLGMPKQFWPQIVCRWKAEGGPPLAIYAPYTAHCLLVDTFFHVAVAKRLISPDRLSNRTDIAYLYYLPFATVFVSNDNLHRRTVPLFLRDSQLFLAGKDLKRDLQALDDHYSALPKEALDQGLFRIARHPPHDSSFLTTRIYQRLGFMRDSTVDLTPPQSEKLGSDIRAMVDGMERESEQPTSSVTWAEAQEPEQIAIQRRVPRQWGKWKIMPPGVGED